MVYNIYMKQDLFNSYKSYKRIYINQLTFNIQKHYFPFENVVLYFILYCDKMQIKTIRYQRYILNHTKLCVSEVITGKRIKLFKF